MTEFAFIENEHGETESCCSCGAEAPLIETKNMNIKSRGTDSEDVKFCEICYTTYAGNAYCYPDQYQYGIPAIIAGIGNIIRRDIGAFKSAPRRQ